MAKKTHDGKSAPVSRRRFLGGVGAAAAAASAPTIFVRTALANHQQQQPRFVIREDRFGRIFPELPPFFDKNTPRLQAALRDIGKLGGRLDANDELGDGGEAAAVALIANPALSANNQNNAVMKAGTTFIGQFIDHDLTFDLNSRLAVVTEPTQSPNVRDPRFDLDSVYGGGPSRMPSSTRPGAGGRSRPSCGSRAEASSRTCRAIPIVRPRSSPTRETTRT